ncbi:MAG: hypothetical protein BGP03_09430 [Pseudonocardia sp. 73-21]|uniref:hypothetical protein n=1 Tax=uncultured Pseudonocardia sp. TaxID=211455 RepID=UPI00095D7ECA|nr:hypothetical protein [uncultured Pseudonocardia sp.]OJY37777.1 MAG: hypothetical protein BGP03_09430 [Pseudonocardia sp. 73-21]
MRLAQGPAERVVTAHRHGRARPDLQVGGAGRGPARPAGTRRVDGGAAVLSAVSGVLAQWLLTESRADREQPVDLAGTGLLGAALTAVLGGLVGGRSGWDRRWCCA